MLPSVNVRNRQFQGQGTGNFCPLLRLCHAGTCAAGFYPIRTAEIVDSAMLDSARGFNGDAKMPSRFREQQLDIKSNQILRLTAY